MRRVFYCLLVIGIMTVSFATPQKQTALTIPSPVSRITFDQLTSYVAQQKGKPLVINFWATWCEPCVEELPDLIKLYNAHHKEGLNMVGFSVDFPEQTEKVVKPFVDTHKIPYPIYVADPDDQDTLINYFAKAWSGAVPATFLYDKKGKLVHAHFGKMTYSEMEEFIQPAETPKKKN